MEKDGLVCRKKERHWCKGFGDLNQIPGRSRMVGPTGPLVQTSVPPPLPCFPVRTALGRGLLFFLKTQLKRKEVHHDNNEHAVLDSWNSL